MDLSEKQESLLDFIRRFQEVNNRNPRLTELTTHFNISNSAILQRLENLRENGYIMMPDGVLSITLRPKYDVFISYSSHDKGLAHKIQKRLETEGFRVWRDTGDLKIGDSFPAEIYKAIRNSKVFLLLVSDNALQSKFVKEEMAHANYHAIYSNNPKILPVEIEKISLELFPEVQHVQRQRLFDIDDELQMIQLMDAIQIKIYSRSSESKKVSFNSNFEEFRIKVLKDLDESTQKNDGYEYFEFTLEPLEDPGIKKLQDIEDILRKSKIEIQRWGGFDMPPFYEGHENLRAIATQNDVRFFKEFGEDQAWFRTWELYAFSMDRKGNFFYRNSLRESFAKEENIRDKFSIDWLILDVTRALMFAKNLTEITSSKNWKLTVKYHGLKGKKLIILSSRRSPLFWNYVKEVEDDYVQNLEINDNTIIKERAFDICHEVMWLFGWKTINEEMLKKDIDSYMNKIFPE